MTYLSLFLFLIPLFSLLAGRSNAWNNDIPNISSAETRDRRSFVKNVFSTAAALSTPMVLSSPIVATAITTDVQQPPFNTKNKVDPPIIYKVIPDTSEELNPSLRQIQQKDLVKQLEKSSGALWLGEHHNSQRDHDLQVDLIKSLHAIRSKKGKPNNANMAIGLEQVQIKFQPILDDYIANKISIDDFRKGVEWDTRWTWPFEVYRSVFETAHELSIPLIALNVNSEDLVLVEKGGLPNLPKQTMLSYIPDPVGFSTFARPSSFRCYVDYVISPSYDMHKSMGLLKYTSMGEKMDTEMPFRNFFSSRILWDECMASTAYDWTKKNPDGLIVGLVGADHVKFRDGIPGRYERLAASALQNKSTLSTTSVMLNPSLIDTRPSGTVNMLQNSVRSTEITLQLRYEKDGLDSQSSDRFKRENFGGVLPLADYLLFSPSS